MRDLTAKETAGRLRAALTAGSLNWEKLAVAVLGRPALRADVVARIAELLEGDGDDDA